ncbi:SUKH-4 family immunity protein [Streptomyces sp. RB6PN25]|uniref:SUKH-4 family immunity protein n=1 Tax=Streptomyces humicola TaxID=2953240 RepID=A0ABT1PR85_9ACTN|nr:SUKH-4 family immunity protein [Streptomyces humicola]MCQ4079465.1 SUKH-4 family immunity protein [Streptomyces humicola]
MTFAISREAMEKEFGADNLVTAPADRLNPAITHAPTVQFLSEVGMPDVDEFVYTVDDDLASGLVGALERQPNLGDYTDKPLDNWVVLGWFVDDKYLLDGATGEVWIKVDGDETVKFMNTRVDFFARFLASFHRDYELLHPDYAMPDEIETAMNNLITEVRGLDPFGVGHEQGYWHELADRIAWQY